MTNTLHKQIQIGTCVQIQIGERQWARFVSRWCQTCPFATQLYSLVYILLFTITCPSAIRTALQYQHHLHCFRCLLDIYIYIYIYTVFMGDVQLLEFHWNPFFEAVSHNHLFHFHFSVYQCVLLGDSLCVRPASPQGHTKGNIGAPNQHFAIGEHSAKWEHQFCHFPIGDHSGEWENQFCLSDCEKGYSSKMMFRSRGKYLIYFLQGKHGQPSLLDLFYQQRILQ